jgi:hypothetical protein
MIKANELRIGNFIDYAGDVVEVEGIKYKDEQGHQRIYLKEGGAKMSFLNPVPITEDWLLKFGVNERMKGIIRVEANPFHYYNFDMIITLPDGKPQWLTVNSNLEYVHQLQNLFFALTGEEL